MSQEQTNIPADFWDSNNPTLQYIEDGIRAVECNNITGLAVIAISFGRIKKDKLYHEAGYSSFKDYILSERTYTKYKQAIKLSRIGVNWWKYRNQMAENGIRLSGHMSKVDLLSMADISNDPMFWQKFKSFSVKGLREYMNRVNDGIYEYPAVFGGSRVDVSGSSILLDGVKVRGFNINDARKETAAGKRAVVVWVDNDNEARRVRRRLER
jgi:hypothetical protein